MRHIDEFLHSGFAKGIAVGAIVVLLLFVSWKFVLLAGGILALYYLIVKR